MTGMFEEELRKITWEAFCLMFGIVGALLVVYFIDFYSRWREIGRKYRSQEEAIKDD